jgi:hypothetical protein
MTVRIPSYIPSSRWIFCEKIGKIYSPGHFDYYNMPPLKITVIIMSTPPVLGDPWTMTMHPSNEVPFLCLSARFMLISFVYACQHI